MRPEIRFFQGDKEINVVDFGIVQEGSFKRISITVMNTGNVAINEMYFEPEDVNVKVIEAPKYLEPQQKSDIVLKYFASQHAASGLKTKLLVSGSYLV